jgi:hypothetical protein
LYSVEVASGKPTQILPYKAVADGRITLQVDGLPEGVQFKDPGDFSLGALKEIVANEEKIKMLIKYVYDNL